MSTTKLQSLNDEQIAILEKNGCGCADWSQVRTAAGFRAEHVVRVAFVGAVDIGRMDGTVLDMDGVERPAGLHNVRLRNVRLGDNCAISNVGGELANLEIGHGVWIENVAGMACRGLSAFGNGHAVSVLNEAGGREVRITARTSAQTAYLTALYRDRAGLAERMHALADDVADELRAERAIVGNGARVAHCGELVNVRVGPHAVIHGALRLEEGTIESSQAAPTRVGHGVVARHFILQKGACVEDGAVLVSTLIGEAARVGRQFSAENSVFFANAEGYHSEVCSVFGGPYTVTHHRSTLLIAGLFSFFNAGSGTNQSNHMYKLGPVHQGILERGCKTGSFSYLLFPVKIGAFTAVIGKHYANFDTSDFPFSYIAEEDGKSTLVPAMNYFTVGTLRDGEKWPARDRRADERKLDQIVFDVLSPFTARKMARACRILERLGAESDRSQTYVTCNGIHIKRLLMKTCGRYYKLALDQYFGDALVRRLRERGDDSVEEALARDPAGRSGESEWVDVCGLLCRQDRLDEIVERVQNGALTTLDALQGEFETLAALYPADAWNACLSLYAEIHGASGGAFGRDQALAVLDAWKSASLKLINMVLGDAQKEFEGSVRIGFGIDGAGDADFEAVRGTFDANSFVRDLRVRIPVIEKTREDLAAALQA